MKLSRWWVGLLLLLAGLLSTVVACSEPTRITPSDQEIAACQKGFELAEGQPSHERRAEVRQRYLSVLHSKPNVLGVGMRAFKDADGEWTDVHGLIVTVDEVIDQNSIPEANRIPACLDGVPVQIEQIEQGEAL